MRDPGRYRNFLAASNKQTFRQTHQSAADKNKTAVAQGSGGFIGWMTDDYTLMRFSV
jgi:hypothetical protein